MYLTTNVLDCTTCEANVPNNQNIRLYCMWSKRTYQPTY